MFFLNKNYIKILEGLAPFWRTYLAWDSNDNDLQSEDQVVGLGPNAFPVSESAVPGAAACKPPREITWPFFRITYPRLGGYIAIFANDMGHFEIYKGPKTISHGAKNKGNAYAKMQQLYPSTNNFRGRHLPRTARKI